MIPWASDAIIFSGQSECVGIKRDIGHFPWERVNPNVVWSPSAIPLGATGARDLNQAVKELAALPKVSRAIVSVYADVGYTLHKFFR